jgi:carbamoyl-phosphate synthase large subunit
VKFELVTGAFDLQKNLFDAIMPRMLPLILTIVTYLLLKKEGIKVILINSNPATIMTDKGVADKTYIEPITIGTIEKIIEIEKPDAILPTLGGQTALNVALLLHEQGILKKHNVKIIGASIKAIKKGEDRDEFKKVCSSNWIPIGHSSIIHAWRARFRICK